MPLAKETQMKVRDIIRLIEKDGWRFHSQRGSHQQYVHPIKTGRVTVAGKPGHDLHPKTEADIFRQAKLERPK
jgi:predicted RNA binding protein YcfA (HicA-like mRNA interferase family)